MPGFRIADAAQHLDLLELARKQTTRIMEAGPDLKGPEGEALRTLLYMFDRDGAIRLMSAG
jgi:ATP-dependent DNA helicase RecG